MGQEGTFIFEFLANADNELLSKLVSPLIFGGLYEVGD